MLATGSVRMGFGQFSLGDGGDDHSIVVGAAVAIRFFFVGDDRDGSGGGTGNGRRRNPLRWWRENRFRTWWHRCRFHHGGRAWRERWFDGSARRRGGR